MNSFDEERFAYRDKIGKTRDAIQKLLQISCEHDGLFDRDICRKLNEYQKKCEKLYTKLDKNEFEIAIVGLEKAGKSTFGNALMENNVLPNADERCTYTATCIRYGQDRAVVKFFNTSEINQILRGYLETLGVDNVESYTLDSLQTSTYKDLYNKLDQRDRERYENTVNQDILNLIQNKNSILKLVGSSDQSFEKDALDEDYFKDFIINPKVAVAVKEVCIESAKIEKMSNAVIYDVPGFDSPTSMHEEQTKKRMKECDAIMLIASAEKPSFTAPALKIFNEVTDEDNVSLSDKLFIFGNKADSATTLAKNINTLKDEARRWKLLNGNLVNDRIVVGSARAHLQKLGAMKGSDSIQKVESDDEYKNAWEHGDGIEYIYNKLVEYNETERFQIIKNKVKRTVEELKELFTDLREKSNNVSAMMDPKDLLNECDSLRDKAVRELEDGLKSLRNEIRERYNSDIELSKKLQSEVVKLFREDNHDKYLISDEDINSAKLEIYDTSGSVNVEKVEEIIREEKFKIIIHDFSSVLFSIAQRDHNTYYERIIDLFKNALGLDRKSKDNDVLLEKIKSFVNDCRSNNENSIYQSLIERFVRDLVEVLIARPFCSEARLNKFIDESEVFSGLIMFYNDGDAQDGYRKLFLSIPPKNQPLLLALVFHEYKDVSETCKSFMDSLSELSSGIEINDILQLGYSIIKRDPIGGYQTIKKILGKNRDEKQIVGDLRTCQRDQRDVKTEHTNNSSTVIKFDFDFSDKEKFAEQYKAFFGAYKRRDYDDVKSAFEVDLGILENFLVHASIPAIRIEKPFVSREVQSISDLMEKVKGGDLARFIISNSDMLLRSSIERLNVAAENFMANREAMIKVNEVLETLNY